MNMDELTGTVGGEGAQTPSPPAKKGYADYPVYFTADELIALDTLLKGRPQPIMLVEFVSPAHSAALKVEKVLRGIKG